MTVHSLAELLFEHGILTAAHPAHCARNNYAAYIANGDLLPCSCHLETIQAEVRHQLADTHKDRMP